MDQRVTSEHIERTIEDGVQTLRLARPEKKNAITRPMYAALAAHLRDADTRDDIRVTVFAGQPGAFSAGNDMSDFMAYATTGALGGEILDFLSALSRADHPLVSVVDGLAIGIGTTIHLHCDATFASPRSRFATPFVDLALVPEAASSLLLPRIMGHQQAFAMLGAGHSMSAEEAQNAGLILGVVPEEQLEEKAFAYARDLVSKPVEALRIAKRLMRPNADEIADRIEREAEHFADQLRSDEAKAAFAAFLSRKT